MTLFIEDFYDEFSGYMYYSVILKCLEFNQFFPLGEIIYFYMIPFEKNKKNKKTMRWEFETK